MIFMHFNVQFHFKSMGEQNSKQSKENEVVTRQNVCHHIQREVRRDFAGALLNSCNMQQHSSMESLNRCLQSANITCTQMTQSVFIKCQEYVDKIDKDRA